MIALFRPAPAPVCPVDAAYRAWAAEYDRCPDTEREQALWLAYNRVATERPGVRLIGPAPHPEAQLCRCTDGGRQQPRIACLRCKGTGWVR